MHMDTAPYWVAVWELALFAGVFGIIFGLDDLMVDALWLAGVGRKQPVRLPSEPRPLSRRFAIFIPAWDEGAVIGAMLDHCTRQWAGLPCRIYVGVYLNDVQTMRAVAAAVAQDDRIVMRGCVRPGPTTKADCLNQLWQAMLDDRASGQFLAEALVLHDAEDLVDAAELHAHDRLLDDADFVQLPVRPLVHRDGRLISGHYVDEFAESHGKELPVRAAIGALLPTAGVGCAFRIDRLEACCGPVGPFSADSLTEDYELGLRLAAAGGRGALGNVVNADGAPIVTAAHFPHSYFSSVRQKARWTAGIALDGWLRLGWPLPASAPPLHKAAAAWMLWRDRRSPLSAVVIAAGYAALLLGAILTLVDGKPAPVTSPGLAWLLACNGLLLGWRAVWRVICTVRMAGWRQAMPALARMPVANAILIATVLRALRRHWRTMQGRANEWDKTAHEFPALAPSASSLQARR